MASINVAKQDTSARIHIAKTAYLILMATACSLVSSVTHAYYSTLDTGDLIEPQKYRVSIEPQMVFSRYDGFNLVGRFDTGIDESSSVRAILGFGTVDFQMGALYKIVPFPDTPSQPAVGAEAGFIFAHVQGGTEVSLRFHPLISKKLHHKDLGDFTAYASLPTGITTRSGSTFVPLQLVGGGEIKIPKVAGLSVMAELGVNVLNAFTYLSGSVLYRFDEVKVRTR